MSLLISVVICTYNRSDLLTDALQTVCQQTLDHAEYEVIVVDNNSTDKTRDVTQSFVARYSNVRYCLEPQQALSHARNRGWQEAKGEIVAYIDDDVKLPPEWLMVAKEVIKNVSPDVLSGPSFAFYNSPKPYWFKDSYGSHEPYDKAGISEQPDELYGHNLLFRRELLAQSGGFDPTLGMVGDQIAYGEETALLRHIQTTMPETLMYYEPKLYLYHLVRPEKMTWGWLIKERFIKGRYVYRVFRANRENKAKLFAIIREALIVSLRLLLGIILFSHFRRRDKQPYWQQYLYESSLNHVKRLGMIYEQFQQRQPGIYRANHSANDPARIVK